MDSCPFTLRGYCLNISALEKRLILARALFRIHFLTEVIAISSATHYNKRKKEAVAMLLLFMLLKLEDDDDDV